MRFGLVDISYRGLEDNATVGTEGSPDSLHSSYRETIFRNLST